MKQGVLLLAHGAPERLEDVESYLTFVRGGRPASARIVEEVKSRYQAIGGSSPLLAWTRVQAQALVPDDKLDWAPAAVAQGSSGRWLACWPGCCRPAAGSTPRP